MLERPFWIFDLDGTLTVAVHDFVKIRCSLGLPEDLPILEAVEALPTKQKLIDELDRIELEIARSARPQEGAFELLTTLRDKKKTLAILTRNSLEAALVTLQTAGLEDFFDEHLVIGRETLPFKPSPYGVQRLMKRASFSPDETLIVGDYRFDLQAGRSAGIKTIHLDVWGRFIWPEWADKEIIRLSELTYALGCHVRDNADEI